MQKRVSSFVGVKERKPISIPEHLQDANPMQEPTLTVKSLLVSLIHPNRQNETKPKTPTCSKVRNHSRRTTHISTPNPNPLASTSSRNAALTSSAATLNLTLLLLSPLPQPATSDPLNPTVFSNATTPEFISSIAAKPNARTRAAVPPLPFPSRKSFTPAAAMPATATAASAIRFASSRMSPKVDSEIPVRRTRERRAARKSLADRGRQRRDCWSGVEVASWMACLIVAIVTLVCLGWFGIGVGSFLLVLVLALGLFIFPLTAAPLARLAGVLLGVGGRGSVSGPFVVGFAAMAASLDCSAISTARRQMSSARRASPLTAATLRLANWTASGSTMFPGTLDRREPIISMRSVCL